MPQVNEKPKNALGQELQRLRKERKFTLRQVEELTEKNVSNSYLSQLESGDVTKPSPDILFDLAKVYDVPYRSLMVLAGYVDPASPKPRPASEKDIKDTRLRLAFMTAENLDDDDKEQAINFISFLATKKK